MKGTKTMDLIELHILQSFPVTCLNRDDVGAPKSAVFGGVQRARVSSQSWKRAIRAMAAADKPECFGGRRGHYVAAMICEALVKEGIEPEQAKDGAERIATFLGEHDAKKKDEHKTSVAVFVSPLEASAIAQVAAKEIREGRKVEPKKGELKKAIAAASPTDLADIAIFGRMVASDHSLMVEGAGLFSHALSTHRTSNEVDFFSAVDEMKPEDSEGAGHIGTLEFNSACYYRYVGLNVSMLASASHLGHMDEASRGEVIKAFLKSAIFAVPEARKNSMFGFAPPAFVLGLRRQGHPLSLINAFEEPVPASSSGFLKPSVKRLKDHLTEIETAYKITPVTKLELPEVDVVVLIDALTTGKMRSGS